MTYFTRFSKQHYPTYGDSTKELTNISQYTAFFSMFTDDISYYTYYNVVPDERYDTISYKLYDTVDYYWTILLLNPNIVNTFRDSLRSVGSVDKLLKQKYPGKCIVIDDSESIAGKFQIGEIVEYFGSGQAKYKIREKYTSLNYLVADELDDSSEYETDGNLGQIIGVTSGSVATVSIIVDYAIATHHYEDSETGAHVPYYAVGTVPVSIPQVERDRNESYSQIKVIRPEFIEEVVDRFKEEMKGLRG